VVAEWGREDDVEYRVAVAAEARRQHEVTTRRCADLDGRVGELAGELAGLREQLAAEEHDVERLEGLSLGRLLASLRGTRDDALARERAEADIARYRVAEAAQRLAAVQRELAVAREQLDRLAAAPEAYAAALTAKERYLTEGGDPRGLRLLALAEERGRLSAELRELREAQVAADTAAEALATVQDMLDSAGRWSTYDTFFGGGMISSSIKHHRLDEAAAAAGYADQCLAVLRTELADVPDIALGPQLEVSRLTRFADVWFDNVFTDLAVRGRIRKAQDNLFRCLQLVTHVRRQLQRRDTRTRARLAAIRTERHDILTT
jgi:hypothetical protein